MMIHEKLMSGQFLLGLKNDRSGLLQAAAAVHHHQQQPLHMQPPSPPMPALELYSAYAYQHQLQQQLLNSAMPNHQQSATVHASTAAEVLDLSRRCESGQTQRKTPSPYHTDSDSPSILPVPQKSAVTANFVYAAQTQQLPVLPSHFASLYPGLYYPKNVKQEPISITTTTPTPPPPPPHTNPAPLTVNAPLSASASILQSVTTATTTVPVRQKHDVAEPHSPKQQQQQSVSQSASTPTSSTNGLPTLDVKTTRPFKAFPRDPLVIAANFAATDCLLDESRVERYTEYRKRILEQIRSSNGGSRTVTNPKMRRTNSSRVSNHEGSSGTNSDNEERHHNDESSDCDSNSGNDSQLNANGSNSASNCHALNISGGIIKDAAYYERRRKNNAAAKKSRDRRRIKEDEIAIRAAYLERQNIELLCQIDSLKSQLSALTSKLSN